MALVFYYTRNNLQNFKGQDYDSEIPNSLAYNKFQTTQLFADTSLNTVGGQAFFNIAILNTPNPSSISYDLSFDTELGYYFINAGPGGLPGCIFFNVSVLGSTTPGYAPNGSNIRQITGGSGSYFGATGQITLLVNNSTGLRTVTINATLPA